MNSSPKKTSIRVTLPLKDLQVWQRFVVGLRSENRFNLAEESEEFVNLIIDYAKTHKTVTLPRNTSFYRARINDFNNTRTPIALENMGAPPANLAGHSRLNPTGIPYLYLASEKITALSEVRPWVGCEATLAEFTLKEDCDLINFSQKYFVNIPEGEEYKGSEFTWGNLITWMFSAPFDPRDDIAYIPTQFLAERIKGAGFSGILYDSALSSSGYNVTLFNTSLANAVRRENAFVTSINIEAIFDKLSEYSDMEK